MSSITILEQTSAPAAAEAMGTAGAPDMAAANVTALPMKSMRYTLKRTGGRPMVFEGRELCASTSHSIGPSLWYEVNIYEKTDASYVVEIKMFTKSEKTKDQYSVYEAYSLDDVASVLESHDAAGDVDGSLLKFDDPVAPGRFALQAASFRLQIEEANHQYKDLVGEILFQLCK